MGHGRRATVTSLTLVAAFALSTNGSGVAQAALATWSGQYHLITYASQKVGTSPASQQWEGDFSGDFTLSTNCSTGTCIATVVQGPPPSNSSIPQPIRYAWNGSEWITSYDWMWNCYQGDGYHRLMSPATSWVFYTPQPDGSMRGTWHTDIDTGPCRGSVIMPIAAFPS